MFQLLQFHIYLLHQNVCKQSTAKYDSQFMFCSKREPNTLGRMNKNHQDILQERVNNQIFGTTTPIPQLKIHIDNAQSAWNSLHQQSDHLSKIHVHDLLWVPKAEHPAYYHADSLAGTWMFASYPHRHQPVHGIQRWISDCHLKRVMMNHHHSSCSTFA